MKIWRRNRRATFEIFIPQHIYHKMLAYAQVCDGEISGWGKTKVTKKKDDNVTYVTVLDIRIFKQTVTDTHTSIDADALTKFYVELAKEGENMSNWNLWWHSHNDFNVFFSSEDEKTIKKTASGRLYSICINKKGELTARVDEKGKVLAENIDPKVENPVNDSLMAACRAEVKKKVKKEKVKPVVIIRNVGVDYISPFTPTRDRFPSITSGSIPPLDDEHVGHLGPKHLDESEYEWHIREFRKRDSAR
jgi:hypothetical protein